MQGVHLAYKHSVIASIKSNLFLIEKFMKFVSIRTLYGGPREVLYWKNREEETFSLGSSSMFIELESVDRHTLEKEDQKNLS